MERKDGERTHRTMVRVSVSSDNEYLIFQTVSREWKSGSFYIGRSELAELEQKEQVIAQDCGYLAVLRRNRYTDTVEIIFYWMQCTDGASISGRRNVVTLSWPELSGFAEQSAREDGPKEWLTLSRDCVRYPRLVFANSGRLREVAANKLVRRKLSRFLRTAFRWPDVDEIRLYGDFTPYSFTFQEIRHGQEGIFGGVILHGQEDMRKAYYGIHT